MSWSYVSIDVVAFSAEAEKRAEELDLSRFDLEEEIVFEDGRFSCELDDVDFFEDNLDNEFTGPFLLMRALADALGSDGKATIVLKSVDWENEFNTCLVYYYLGDEIKLRKFYDNDTGCYDFHDFLSVLLDMKTDSVKEIIEEMDKEVETEEDYDDEDELNSIVFDERYHLIYSIAYTLGYYDFYQSKRNITRHYDGPKVAALFDLIDELRPACCFSYDELESDDFSPNLNWEEKGIAKFTENEKEMLLK